MRIGLMLWALCHAGVGLQACGHVDPPPAPPPPGQVADCAAACKNEKALGCPAAASCQDICPRLLRNHSDYVLCVTGATTCDQVNGCNAPKAGGATHGPGSGRSGP